MTRVYFLFIPLFLFSYSYPQNTFTKSFSQNGFKEVQIFKSYTAQLNSISALNLHNRGNYEISNNFRPFPGNNSTQSEFSITVNPLDYNQLLFSANATDWPVTVFRGVCTYLTSDGGESWTGSDYPSFGSNYGYPVSAIGINGIFYQGFLNNSKGQSIAVSTDYGNSWTTHLVASSTGILDKNHFCIDNKKGSPFENRLYAAWTRFEEGNSNNNKIEFSCSSDGGNTWTFPKNVSEEVGSLSHDYGVNIQTGPRGEVYCTWAVYDQWSEGRYGEDAIGFNVSMDGGVTWGTGKRIYSFPDFGINGYIKSTKIRVASFPTMSVDQNSGEIYICWSQAGVIPAGNSPDIVLIKSTDGGNTWSNPVRVNDDPISNGKDQYYNWSFVDQSTGSLYLLFYDSRNVNNDSTEVYLTRSTDHGNTFENIRISDEAFKPKPIKGLTDGYQGDYIGIAAQSNIVYCIWGEDRTGNYQGWMSKLRFLPVIKHIPSENTEDILGPYKIEVQINSALALNQSKLFLIYWRDGSLADTSILSSSGDKYIGYIPGEEYPYTYYYYIYVEDISGACSKLPVSAPAECFSFKVIIDKEPPVIFHSSLKDQLIEKWPPDISAEVTDQIGVNSVIVEYKKNQELPKSFRLYNNGGIIWRGNFDINSQDLKAGDMIYYRILAVDKSIAGNISYLPMEDYFTFKIISSKALILLVDDEDYNFSGPSSTLIIQSLSETGLSVDYARFQSLPVASLNKYDCVVLCAGTKNVSIFDDPAIRKAIIDYNKSGGKIFVEGGEVGWIYRYSDLTIEKDPSFRRTVLRDSNWVNDCYGGMVKKNDPNLTVFYYPEPLRDSIFFKGSDPAIETDAVNIIPDVPGIYKLAGWIPKYPNAAAIIAYSPIVDLNNITNIYCTFAVSAIKDSLEAGKLIRNLLNYLLFGNKYIPVELISFNVSYNGDYILLTWQTGSEKNNFGFQIRRKKSGSEYEPIGFIPGKGTTTEISEYSFADNLTPGIYKYKLSQIDFNGDITFSRELEVSMDNLTCYSLEQNYPNPFNSRTVFNFSLFRENYTRIIIFNSLGEEVAKLDEGVLKAGKHSVQFNSSEMPSGVYFYRIESGDFRKTKKMVLLK